MVDRGLVATRSAAQRAIAAGGVRVGGVPLPKPATMVAPDTPIALAADAARYVSRGGLKLAGALADLGVDVTGARCLDAGASTGGFTDCLLQHGAAAVTAVDVGYGQLAWSLRNDPRVRVFERANIRHLGADDVDGPFDVVVADLSFISLVTVAEALAAMGADHTDYVLLVKPQFEVGPESVAGGGVVREPALHADALERVAAGLDEVGIGVVAAVPSRLEGHKAGNREFFVHGRPGPRRCSSQQLLVVAAP